ncbi:MAG TPA: ABC transporter ATP-binding protein [Alphaproteobacteria bacterium]|nr:ABC transporter ATP-binding protein [Alphaproteobacteria bacterium]
MTIAAGGRITAEGAAAAPETAIAIREVSKAFPGGTVALDRVSLDIRANEFFTLLGPSGCGKTTLLRLIGGFEEASGGRIELHGQPIEGLPPHRRPVNTVFQSYALFPHLSVADNIGFALEMQGVARAERERRIADMLALVRLTGMEGRRPNQLSGGQQQRVALARALAAGPKVLLLDEPLSALDLKLRKEMQIELKRLQRETGITFVFVTHDQEEALTMSDRIAVMESGKVLQVGTPHEIYERPARRFVAGFIGETNLLTATGTGGRTLRLGGGEVAVEATVPAGTSVTIASRPERLRLAPPGEGLAGLVEDVVYFGTDTNYHVALEGGGRVAVRVQNRGQAAGRPLAGSRVGVVAEPGAWQVLLD